MSRLQTPIRRNDTVIVTTGVPCVVSNGASALDPSLVGEVLKVMEDLAHEGRTMIVVTHEMAFAREAADRVYFMDDGQFIEIGPPEQVLENPKDERTRTFLERFLQHGGAAGGLIAKTAVALDD